MDENTKKIDEVQIEKTLSDFIRNGGITVADESEDNLGKDLQIISKELTKDENVFRFGNANKNNLHYDALLKAIGDRPFYDKDIKPRYEFIQRFCYHYAINCSAVHSAQADRFKELGGSLLGFKALLAYREAGISNNGLNADEKKHGIMDRLKKG